MRRHFVVAMLVLLLAPGLAQARRTAARKSHHRTAAASSRRLAKNNVADAGRTSDPDPPASAIPLSWLLVILAGVVAVAFIAFTGMCLNPQHPSPQASLAHSRCRS